MKTRSSASVAGQNLPRRSRTMPSAKIAGMTVLSLAFTMSAFAQTEETFSFQAGVSNGMIGDPSYNTDDAHVQPHSGKADENLNEPVIRLKTRSSGDPVYGFFRFDLSEIKGKKVASASLTLTVKYCDVGNGISQSLYALPPGNTDWSESTATYNHQIDTTPWMSVKGTYVSAEWAGLGGILLDSFDGMLMSEGQTVTFKIDPSVAQEWADDPKSFSGLFLTQTEGEDQFYYWSGEAMDRSSRPVLSINVEP